jgi:hypothetical protein
MEDLAAEKPKKPETALELAIERKESLKSYFQEIKRQRQVFRLISELLQEA